MPGPAVEGVAARRTLVTEAATEPTRSLSFPGRSSEGHRHNEAETVRLILDGSGAVRIGKGAFHGVRAGGESLTFPSVQSPSIFDKARRAIDLEPRNAGG